MLEKYYSELLKAVAGLTGLFIIMWLAGGNFSYKDIRWITGLYVLSTILLFYEHIVKKR